MRHCGGVRVGATAERTNLSRPAVSHHLQILKDAGFLKVRRDGTRNYYYGKFSGVENYIALIGPKCPDLEEKCGYYGERLVLLAQTLGLNPCWVATTYERSRALSLSAAGRNSAWSSPWATARPRARPQVQAHGCDDADKRPHAGLVPPGTEAALLDPTAMDQQKFTLTLSGNTVAARAGTAFYSKVDLGIAKYHFELEAGKEIFTWSE